MFQEEVLIRTLCRAAGLLVAMIVAAAAMDPTGSQPKPAPSLRVAHTSRSPSATPPAVEVSAAYLCTSILRTGHGGVLVRTRSGLYGAAFGPICDGLARTAAVTVAVGNEADGQPLDVTIELATLSTEPLMTVHEAVDPA